MKRGAVAVIADCQRVRGSGQGPRGNDWPARFDARSTELALAELFAEQPDEFVAYMVNTVLAETYDRSGRARSRLMATKRLNVETR